MRYASENRIKFQAVSVILLISMLLKFSLYITVLVILFYVAQCIGFGLFYIHLQVMAYEKTLWMSYCLPFYYN